MEDIASQSSVVFKIQYTAWLKHEWKDTISSVPVAPVGAETLVRRNWITIIIWQYALSAASLRKITKIGWCALKLQCATTVSFFETRCINIFNELPVNILNTSDYFLSKCKLINCWQYSTSAHCTHNDNMCQSYSVTINIFIFYLSINNKGHKQPLTCR